MSPFFYLSCYYNKLFNEKEVLLQNQPLESLLTKESPSIWRH